MTPLIEVEIISLCKLETLIFISQQSCIYKASDVRKHIEVFMQPTEILPHHRVSRCTQRGGRKQQVQRIFMFSLRSQAGARPRSGGPGAVVMERDVSIPSFRERGLHT